MDQGVDGIGQGKGEPGESGFDLKRALRHEDEPVDDVEHRRHDMLDGVGDKLPALRVPELTQQIVINHRDDDDVDGDPGPAEGCRKKRPSLESGASQGSVMASATSTLERSVK